MAQLRNTSISSGGLIPPVTSTFARTEPVTFIQSFTTVGTTSWTAPAGVNRVEVLVVAGGGGGGGGFDTWAGGGGGGAGGLIYRQSYAVTPNSSYTVTVGGGGAGGIGSNSPRFGGSGGNSVFDTLIAIGGGGGNAWNSSTGSTAPAGGSGGGGQNSSGPFTPAAGTAGQGNAGGAGMTYTGTNASSAGGGGGAGSVGGEPATNQGGGGGQGLYFDISGIRTVYAAGGGGGGGTHGGGSQNGGRGGNGTGSNGVSANANTGGGGGGAGSTLNPNGATNGGAGGSGIVILRWLQTADNSDPAGETRFNADLSEIEVYDNENTRWICSDQSKNFAGHNILLRSQELDVTASWTRTNVGVTANTATAPDGTVTADKITETVTNGIHSLQQSYTNANASLVHCFSCYAKAVENSRLQLAITHTGTTVAVSYNLATVTRTTVTGTVINSGIKALANGWYRLHVAFTATGSAFANILLENASGNTSYAGVAGNGVLVFGCQMETSQQTPGPYTKTETARSPTPGNLGGYRIHTFTETGISSFAPAVSGDVEVLVVAGGGGAGSDVGGGGGGGGVVYNAQYPVISGKVYRVMVGAGGGAGAGFVGGTGANGGDSQFATLVAIGGGGGGYYYQRMGYNGGSGGGQGGTGPQTSAIIAGAINPGVGTQGQGHAGGEYRAGAIGGGGGGGAGGPGYDQWGFGADGGPGVPCDISGELRYYGGGGGAGDSGSTAQIGHGGIGGGGDGDSRNLNTPWLQVNGLANTGGGGGADGGFTQSGSGGSGIVIVRYRHF